MSRVLAVATMTLRRHIRSRIVWVVGAVTLGSLGFSQVGLIAVKRGLGGDAAAGEVVMSTLFGFSLPLFTTLIALVAAVTVASCIRSDIAQGTIYSVLSRPLARSEYLVGSLLGSMAVVLLAWFLFGIGAVTMAFLVRDPLTGGHYAAIGGHMLPTLVVSCAALCFATRFNVWAAVGLTVLVLGGRGVVQRIAGLLDLPNAVASTLSFPFPVMHALDGLTRRLAGGDLNPAPVLPGVIHLIDYALVMVVLACFSFRRLDLNRTCE